MNNLSIEFSDRIDQLINDGKGEVQAFELTCEEFKSKIVDVYLNPLRYLFKDLSSCTFFEGDIYYSIKP